MKYLVYFFLVLLLFFRFLTIPIVPEGKTVKISSFIWSDPKQFQTNQQVKIANLKINLPLLPQIQYGDWIVLTGVVRSGEVNDTKIIEHNVSNNIIVQMRGNLVKFYNQTLPAPFGGLTAGIVMGVKSSLGSDLYSRLISTGTSHIVVASGMNVTLFAGFVMGLLVNFVKRQKAIFGTLLCLLIYFYIVGFDPPVIRAGIMIGAVFAAQLTGRVVNTIRVLIITAYLMLLVVPSWLTDVGFLLSFSATLSLILFETRINKLITFVPQVLRESISTSIAAQILSIPVILIFFGRFNPLSFLVNALVLWTVTPVMFIGIVAGILGLVIPSIGALVLLTAYPFLCWFIFIVNMFS